MRVEVAEQIRNDLKEAGFDTVVILPDSKFKELYPMLAQDPDFRYIPVTNEGEGVGIAAGVWLGGKSPIVIMENSGLRVACEPLSRLGITHGIPVLMMVGYIGDIGERNWWGIAHGIVMEPLLQAMRIPYIIVRKPEEFKDAIVRAKQHIAVSLHHVAIVMTGDVVK